MLWLAAFEAVFLVVPLAWMIGPPWPGASAAVYIVYGILVLIVILNFAALLWLGLKKPFLEIGASGVHCQVVVPRMFRSYSWSDIREVSIVSGTPGRVKFVLLTTVPDVRRGVSSFRVPMRYIPIDGDSLLEQFCEFSPESLRVNVFAAEPR